MSRSLFKLMSIELVVISKHLILCPPFLLLPSVFPSIRVFSNKSALCTRWPKYWNFSFNISLSKEFSGLISFRIDWIDLAVQGTLESSPAPKFESIDSRLHYGPALTSAHWLLVNTELWLYGTLSVMYLLFNMLCRFVTVFLPKNII